MNADQVIFHMSFLISHFSFKKGLCDVDNDDSGHDSALLPSAMPNEK